MATWEEAGVCAPVACGWQVTGATDGLDTDIIIFLGLGWLIALSWASVQMKGSFFFGGKLVLVRCQHSS